MTDLLSDTSDINSEEMRKIVDDIEDLDSNLFGDLDKKPFAKSETKDSFPATRPKKSVVFQDTANDDPLGDLMADDDFRQKPVTSKSNLVADLFGLKPTEPAIVSNIKETPKTSTFSTDKPKQEDPSQSLEFETNLSTKKPQEIIQKPNPTENILGNVEKGKITGERDKKSLLMEDLFGSKPGSLGSKESSYNILQNKTTKSELERSTSTSILSNRQPEPPIKSSVSTSYLPNVGQSREPRRGGRRSSAVINDPLGLLSSFKMPEDSLQISISQTKENNEENIAFREPEAKEPAVDLPEWLGGSKKTSKDETEETKKEVTENTVHNQERSNEKNTFIQNPQLPQLRSDQMSVLIGTQFNQQSALVAMQQQEHELRTAGILSQQNEQLNYLLEAQKRVLSEQELKFNCLINKQIERQVLLEEQMKSQRERIDNYIQMLLAQPSNSVPLKMFHAKHSEEETDNKADNTPENLVQKLQLEKQCLENTLDSLKEKHDREINILQESHQKQINFLQEGMDKLESRMRQDMENMEADYEAKIQKLKEDKNEIEQNYKTNIENLKRDHANYIQEIQERHSNNILLLQKEYADTMHNISKAKELENETVEHISTQKSNIVNMLQSSKVVLEDIQNFQQNLQEKYKEFDHNRHNFFKIQEDSLDLMKHKLEHESETVEKERQILMDTVQKLESRTMELTTEFQKRSSEYNEIEERIKIREQTLLKERELFIEQSNLERSHLQAIKEMWMNEQGRHLKIIAEEREAIISEKAKLEVSNRLKIGVDSENKAEIEATLKVAQDAATSANLERQKWKKRLAEIEAQKSQLQEKENQLVQRAKDLEDLTQSAIATREEGMLALKEAQRMKDQHKENLKQLQMQLEVLAQRENKIAAQQLALARERLSARIAPGETPEKDVTDIHQFHPEEYSHFSKIHSHSQIPTHFTDIVDPNLVLLKLNLDNRLDASNEYLADMEIAINK